MFMVLGGPILGAKMRKRNSAENKKVYCIIMLL